MLLIVEPVPGEFPGHRNDNRAGYEHRETGVSNSAMLDRNTWGEE